MNVNVSISAAAGRLPGESSTRIPLNYPPLRSSDVKMITAATGVEFKWPPTEGETFPMVASDLASARYRASLEGQEWGDLTTADLYALRRQGVIDAEFLDKALAYLSGKDVSKADSSRSAVNATPAPATLTETPEGDVKLDGYV